MAKRFSITIADWVFRQYLSNTVNRSKYIEEMIIRAQDLDSGDWDKQKQKQTELVQELRNKDEELRKLKLQLGRYQERFKSQKKLEDVVPLDPSKVICAECGSPTDVGLSQKFKIGPICKECRRTRSTSENFRKWNMLDKKNNEAR